MSYDDVPAEIYSNQKVRLEVLATLVGTHDVIYYTE
jgi:hypothetical protein